MSPSRSSRTLGQTIRDRRVEKHLGLRELARAMEITPSYLSDIENDRRVPAQEVLKTIAKELDLSVDELMALGGRLDEQTERYLKTQPQAAVLFRRISRNRLGQADLKVLLDKTDQIAKKSAG